MTAAIDAKVGRWVGQQQDREHHAATAARAVWRIGGRCGRTRRRPSPVGSWGSGA